MKYFEVATLKLTVFYIVLLMSLSLGYSLWLYTIAGREVQVVWASVMSSSENGTFADDGQVPSSQSPALAMSRERIVRDLLFFNLAVLGGGTLLSYVLARRTLRPIQKSYQLQEEFASNASHELRTPLTALKAELQLVRQDKKATLQKYQAATDSSLEEVNRLIQLSSRLLRLSTPSASSLQPASIHEALLSALKKLEIPIQSKHLQIVLPTEDISVTMDRQDLIEALLIILDNAVKFSPIQDKIIISAEVKPHHTRIIIEDHGPGILPEDLPHIFERFYRSSAMQHQSGHGLGLSIAQRLISELGGSIKVKSQPGQTKFILSLPS